MTAVSDVYFIVFLLLLFSSFQAIVLREHVFVFGHVLVFP